VGASRRLQPRTGRRRSASSNLGLVLQQGLKGLPHLVPIPRGRWQKVLDAGLWVLGAVLLRLALKVLLWGLPVLTVPVYLLMLAPAGLAAYLAFAVPNSSTAVIYRLLLLTLGLFIGGKL
jgi:CBS-domain-containing membrane protein